MRGGTFVAFLRAACVRPMARTVLPKSHAMFAFLIST
jgi:hypothetical protein